MAEQEAEFDAFFDMLICTVIGITDPVYEGKSMAGLIGMIRSGFPFGKYSADRFVGPRQGTTEGNLCPLS